MKSIALTLCAGLLIPAVALAREDDHDLIAGAAALRPAQTSQAASAQATEPASATDSDANADEARARVDVTLAQIRLELLLARKALRADNLKEAAQRAARLGTLLNTLPGDVDAEAYRLQVDGILARAEKAGIDVSAMSKGSIVRVETSSGDPRLSGQVRAAGQIARRYDGADTRDVDTNPDARALRERTQRRQTPDDMGYRPSQEIIDVDAVLERDNQRVYYEGVLEDAVHADEARRLTAANEARIAPDGDITYPDDWPEKVARRQKYEGGQIARGDSWIDKDGREWYVAVYDISDLTYVPPDFQIPGGISLVEDIRNTQDRQALRYRSQIFGGYADDLAAGIPLLRFFGGVDDYEYRGPKYSYERQQQITEMIKAFLDRTDNPEARIISLPPTNP